MDYYQKTKYIRRLVTLLVRALNDSCEHARSKKSLVLDNDDGGSSGSGGGGDKMAPLRTSD